jgi:hypothetical protein
LELLRARGYDVEIVSPDSESDRPTDLEIKIDEYSAEEALDRAEDVPHTGDLYVFVAPGTLAGERVIEIPLLPETAEATDVIFGKQRAAPDAEVPRYSTFASALARASAEPGLDREASFASEFRKQPLENASGDAPATFAEESFFETPVAAAAQNALTHEDVEEMAPTLEITRQTNRFAWFSSSRATLSAFRKTAHSWLDLALVRSAFSSLPSQAYRARTISDATFWQAATVIAALAVSALLVGASARRVPLLAKLSKSSRVTQQLPFTDVNARSIASTTSAARKTRGSVEREHAASVTQIMDEILSDPGQSALTPAARLSARTTRRRPSFSRHEGDMVADDVVVYYNRKPEPPPAPPLVRSGIKHYSDLR